MLSSKANTSAEHAQVFLLKNSHCETLSTKRLISYGNLFDIKHTARLFYIKKSKNCQSASYAFNLRIQLCHSGMPSPVFALSVINSS